MTVNSPQFTLSPAPQPSMEDVWNQFPATGNVATAMAHVVAHTAPDPSPHDVHVSYRAHIDPYRESFVWSLCKTAAQLVLAATVILFVVDGGRSPFAAVCSLGTSLLLLLCVAVADRQRFVEQGATPMIVEVIEPAPQPPRDTRPAPVQLAEQLSVMLDARVDVT